MSLVAEHNIWIFIILTLIFGGAAAYMGGRSLAHGWKPLWMLTIYMCIFGAGLRFLHFALFQDTLTSLYYYVVQTLFILGFSWVGFQITRAKQMTEQYPWLYEKNGPFSWRNKV